MIVIPVHLQCDKCEFFCDIVLVEITSMSQGVEIAPNMMKSDGILRVSDIEDAAVKASPDWSHKNGITMCSDCLLEDQTVPYTDPSLS